MARFVILLALVLLAYTSAAPAENIGFSDASGGSIAVGVVEGATFGDDAFSIASGPEVQNNVATKSCGFIKEIISIFVKGAC